MSEVCPQQSPEPARPILRTSNETGGHTDGNTNAKVRFADRSKLGPLYSLHEFERSCDSEATFADSGGSCVCLMF